jgi:hypothetical protein
MKTFPIPSKPATQSEYVKPEQSAAFKDLLKRIRG